MAGLKESLAGLDNLRGTRRLVNDQLLHQHHQVEAAFRAWARTDSAMRHAVAEVDGARRDASKTMIAALNPDLSPADVDAYADITVLILIGAQTHDPTRASEVSARALASFAAFIERT